MINQIEPDVIHENIWEGTHLRVKLYLRQNFDNLGEIHQVYGVMLDNEDQILLVSTPKRLWTLVGGRLEEGENPVKALIREAKEEANIILDKGSIKPFFYQEISVRQEDGSYSDSRIQVRYICRPKSILEFKEDPGGDICNHKWVSVRNLHKYLKWGETTKFIQDNLYRFL